MALFGEKELIAQQQSEILFLRGQLDASLKREEQIRNDMIELADARAKANIERDKLPKPALEPYVPYVDESGTGQRKMAGPVAPWLNVLMTGEHFDEYDDTPDEKRERANEDAGADAEVALAKE